MAEWEEHALGDLGKVVTGKTPSTSQPENYGGNIPFLTPSDMDGRRIIHETDRYLSEVGVSKVRSSLISSGAVCVSCIGSDMGKTVISGKESVSNQQINSIIIDEAFDNLFVYYNLSGRKDEIKRLAGGAAQPIMNKTDFSNLPIFVPSLSIQKAIATVLGALDDKIENNCRINETLEEMAQAIFKSWFVDFDPVRAKAEGRQPAHMDAETAELFPSSFNEEGLPQGWSLKPLNTVTNIVYGKNLPKTKLKPSGYPVFGGNGVIGYHSEYLYEEPQVLVACRGAASGKVLRSTPKCFVTNNSLVIELSDAPFNRYFVELYLRYLTLEEFTSGSAQPQMTIANMDAVKILLPNSNILYRFGNIAAPVFAKVYANEIENQALALLRDALLPKLMSGEIRVKDAEKTVEAVA
jgi:type I restriction enzyme, S subunit